MEYTLPGLFSIEEQVVLISGATGGIGGEVALAMGSLGARLALTGQNREKLHNISHSLSKKGIEVITVEADITDPHEVKRMVLRVDHHYGRIHALINAAGASYLKEAIDFEETEWSKIIDINLKGTFLMCREVGKIMKRERRGRIVNLSSVRGLQGRARDLAYAPSKGGVNQLTRSLAIEWAKDAINVNAVAPTFTLTQINRNILENEEEYRWIIERIPKGRLCNLNEIVGAIIFLCSPGAEFITGSIIYVDGGWTAN